MNSITCDCGCNPKLSRSEAGYIGGRSTSAKKKAASRANGKKGGRPRGTVNVLAALCIGQKIKGVKALELRRQGKTLKQIADELSPGLNLMAVSRAIKRAEALG